MKTLLIVTLLSAAITPVKAVDDGLFGITLVDKYEEWCKREAFGPKARAYRMLAMAKFTEKEKQSAKDEVAQMVAIKWGTKSAFCDDPKVDNLMDKWEELEKILEKIK